MSYKSVKQVIKELHEAGFVFVSQTGSHMKFKNKDRTAIVPNHSSGIKKGTYISIMKQAGIK